MKDEDRRSMLRLTDAEYRDILNVCAQMPHVTMEHNVTVLDDEDSNVITAGSIVTVKVKLIRENMSVLFDKESTPQLMDLIIHPAIDEKSAIECEPEIDEEEEDIEDNEEESKDGKEGDAAQKKTKVWEKQGKKKKGKGGKKPKKPIRQQHFVKKAAQTVVPALTTGEDTKSSGDIVSESPQASPSQKNKSKSRRKNKENDEVSTEESASEDEDNSDDEEANLDEDMREESVEEDDWLDYDEAKKENSLETKSKETHEVHCPYFPSKKFEWWWLYVADKKTHSLITAPVQLCSLRDEEEVDLKFSAPGKPGKYKYTVVLRSDSYFMDFDQTRTFDMEVKEAKKVETHPQWEEVPSDEDEDRDGSETDVTTDSESGED